MTDPEMAIAFMKSYFPEWDETFDLDGLTILPSEFYDKTLQKRIADLVDELPARSPDGAPLKIAVIIEHKAQSNFNENRKAAANVTGYVVSQSVLPLRNSKLAPTPWATPQALAIMVYTGPEEDYEAPKWEDYFPTPKGFERYAIRFSIPRVNVTRLHTQKQLLGSHALRGAFAGKRSIREERKELLDPFREKDAPKDEKTGYYYKLTAAYSLYASSNVNQTLTPDEFDEMMRNDNLGSEMKTFIDEIIDRRVLEARVQEFLDILTCAFPGVSENTFRQIRNLDDVSKLAPIRSLLFSSKMAEDFERGLAGCLN